MKNQNIFHGATVVYIASIITALLFTGIYLVFNKFSFLIYPDITVRAFIIAQAISTLVGIIVALKFKTPHSRRYILELCGFIWCGLEALFIAFMMPLDAWPCLVSTAIQMSVFIALIFGYMEPQHETENDVEDEIMEDPTDGHAQKTA